MGWSGGGGGGGGSYRSFGVVIGQFDGCDAGMFFMLKTWVRVCDGKGSG